MALNERGKLGIVTIGVAAALCAFGCQSAPGTSSPASGVRAHTDIRPALVMPTATLSELNQRDTKHIVHWEASRNNPAIRPDVATMPDYGGFKMIETRHRENLRTISGRPREHSSSRTRIWERRGVPRRGLFRR